MQIPQRALSVRQPWAELIMRGDKTIEVRNRTTHVRGPVQIYASKKRIEPEEEARVADEYHMDVERLPRGVLVGTVEIVDAREVTSKDSAAAGFRIHDKDEDFGWILANPHRFRHARAPKHQPQPSFFNAG